MPKPRPVTSPPIPPRPAEGEWMLTAKNGKFRWVASKSRTPANKPPKAAVEIAQVESPPVVENVAPVNDFSVSVAVYPADGNKNNSVC